MSRALKQITATGDVVASPAYLRSVIVTGDGTAAVTAVIRDGSGGDPLMTVYVQLAGRSFQWSSNGDHGVFFATAIHVTITGAGGSVAIEYS